MSRLRRGEPGMSDSPRTDREGSSGEELRGSVCVCVCSIRGGESWTAAGGCELPGRSQTIDVGIWLQPPNVEDQERPGARLAAWLIRLASSSHDRGMKEVASPWSKGGNVGRPRRRSPPEEVTKIRERW